MVCQSCENSLLDLGAATSTSSFELFCGMGWFLQPSGRVVMDYTPALREGDASIIYSMVLDLLSSCEWLSRSSKPGVARPCAARCCGKRLPTTSLSVTLIASSTIGRVYATVSRRRAAMLRAILQSTDEVLMSWPAAWADCLSRT